jgi:hypothetical protein
MLKRKIVEVVGESSPLTSDTEFNDENSSSSVLTNSSSDIPTSIGKLSPLIDCYL